MTTRQGGPSARRCLVTRALLLLLAAMLFVPWLWRRDDSLRRLLDAGVLRVGDAVEAPSAWVAAEGRITGDAPSPAIPTPPGCRRTGWAAQRSAA
jgi:hypothetical protein